MTTSRAKRSRTTPGSTSLVTVLGTSAALVGLSGVLGVSLAFAAQPSVGLGKATSFAVLAGTTVTNSGPSVISGNLGVSPGKAVTGFPPGQVKNGTQHQGDALAQQAQAALTTAYDDAAGRTPFSAVSGDLGGQALGPGVYKSASTLGLTGTLTLNAHNDSSAVFVFQAGSSLITASHSAVRLVGGAQACHVFWQVGSSATLGTQSRFVGSVLALTSVTVQTQATVAGRVLARNGQVSLDANTVTVPQCASGAAATGTATTTATASSTPTPAPTTARSSSSPNVVPSGAPSTGDGGAAHTQDTTMVWLGGLALLAACGVMVPALRRRRA